MIYKISIIDESLPFEIIVWYYSYIRVYIIFVLFYLEGNLGMLTCGQFSGWTSPSLPKLIEGNDAKYSIHLSKEEASWVASLLMIGAAGGSILCRFMVNAIGRKNTMLFTAVPSIISWLMIAFATSPWVI